MTEQEKMEFRELADNHIKQHSTIGAETINILLDALDEQDKEMDRLKQVIRDSMRFLVNHSGTVDNPRKLTLDELEELYGFMKSNLG